MIIMPIGYLDPGTGAMIVSAIVGIFATIALAGKTCGYKFLSLFKGKDAAAPPADADDAPKAEDSAPSE
jgi:hypothetical protein